MSLRRTTTERFDIPSQERVARRSCTWASLMRNDLGKFRQVAVEAGTIVWPNGADLDPDVLIWGGMAPQAAGNPPSTLKLKEPSLVP